MTVLMTAASMGHLEIVKYLINKGADVNLKKTGGLTAKDFAIMSLNDWESRKIIGGNAEQEIKKLKEVIGLLE